MKPAPAGGPYRVPPEPNRWPAIALAVAMHALLLAFLWFGIDWQNNEPVAVEAEVWDMKTQVAAPPPPPPEEAEPQPQPETPPPPPKVVEEPKPQPVQPDINLEREKKRKQELLKKQQEEREAEKAREAAEAKEKAEKKALEEKKKQELADKKEAEKKAAEKKKAEKLAKAKAEAADKAKMDKLRAEEMKRIAGAAGTVGAAAKSTAPHSDSGYVAAITAKVKSTTTYLGSTDLPGNPRVEFHVEQLPTGEILSVKKTKSSGVAAFDEAVEKGIIKASPLPKKKDGTVERSLQIGFSMKDMN